MKDRARTTTNLSTLRRLTTPGGRTRSTRTVARSLVAALALASLSTAAPLATTQEDGDASWMQWRGPLATGEALADPPIEWSETKNIAWKAPLPGHGKSTPIVADGRVYVLAAVPAREATQEELDARPVQEGRSEAPSQVYAFLAIALDADTGEVLWETRTAERLPLAGTHETNGYASFSPVTDGKRLYVSFGSYGIHGLDAETGEVEWSYDIGPQRMRRGFGEGGALALAGDTLLVVADQEDQSRIHALDAATGKPRWVKERDEASTWTSALVVEAAGKTQAVVNGTNAARSYDVATGDVLWHCSGQTSNAIPTPVTDGEWVVCASGFRGAACMALSLAGSGDLMESEGAVAWSHDNGTPYVPSPLLTDGRVYFLAGNTGRLSCIDLATGELLVDRHHLDLGNVYASPMAAAGRVYVVGRDGTTVVLRHGDDVEVLATNTLDDPIDASPVAVGGTLYLRSDSHLYAIREP